MPAYDPMLHADRDYAAEYRGRLSTLSKEQLVDIIEHQQEQLVHPPEGWFLFGYHSAAPTGLKLEFWGAGEDLLPLWERPV